MYCVGDMVVYGIHGVCTITAEEQRRVDGKTLHYLILEPLNVAGARYMVPTHNEKALSKLRKMMNRSQLLELLHSEAVRHDSWIDDENLRKQCYRKLISGNDTVELLKMVRSLHSHKQKMLAEGRKFHLCDENFLRDAQHLLELEFAAILEIPREKVSEFVLEQMNP